LLRASSLFTAVLFCCVSACPVIGQSQPAPPQTSPETLKVAYTQALQDKDWQAATAAAQKLVDIRSSAENLDQLANAQIYSNAPQDAITTTDRALEAEEREKPAAGQPDAAWKEQKSKIYLSRGNAYLKLRRNSEAIDAYNQSAALSASPGQPYFNICATLYNIGDTQNGLPACRKSVQVDPTRANAWFVLGSILFADAPIDGKGGVSISPETRQALQKYLELAPDGPHADDVKAMLKMAN